MENLHEFLHSARTDYDSGTLDISNANPDPFLQFGLWMQLAVTGNINEPHAMNLATVSSAGRPSSRIVLLRNFDHHGFVFYTNYDSHKGRELIENKITALNFFWPELHKQVRIEGYAEKISGEESDMYFNTRPRESQIGALVSKQSLPLNSREDLEQLEENLTKQLEGQVITRPENWGGFRVKPDYFEFWQGRPSRLHDRLKYEQQENNTWKVTRLYP